MHTNMSKEAKSASIISPDKTPRQSSLRRLLSFRKRNTVLIEATTIDDDESAMDETPVNLTCRFSNDDLLKAESRIMFNLCMTPEETQNNKLPKREIHGLKPAKEDDVPVCGAEELFLTLGTPSPRKCFDRERVIFEKKCLSLEIDDKECLDPCGKSISMPEFDSLRGGKLEEEEEEEEEERGSVVFDEGGESLIVVSSDEFFESTLEKFDTDSIDACWPDDSKEHHESKNEIRRSISMTINVPPLEISPRGLEEERESSVKRGHGGMKNIQYHQSEPSKDWKGSWRAESSFRSKVIEMDQGVIGGGGGGGGTEMSTNTDAGATRASWFRLNWRKDRLNKNKKEQTEENEESKRENSVSEGSSKKTPVCSSFPVPERNWYIDFFGASPSKPMVKPPIPHPDKSLETKPTSTTRFTRMLSFRRDENMQ